MIRNTITAPEVITVSDVPVPQAERGQVVVRVMCSGICGSDIHAYHNRHPYITLPVITGHEFSGIVSEIGEGVDGICIDDRVAVMPQIYCGQCLNCRSGRYNICYNLKAIGCQAPGAAQEYLAVDARLVLPLPDEMGFDTGSMLEPVAVGVHACRRVDIKSKKVVVLGAGVIGNLTAQVAKALGAEEVLITNTSTPRLEAAKACGIEHTVNVSEQDLAVEINRIWGRDGADVIIECVGKQEAIDQAINVARKGSDIVIAGIFGEKALIDIGLVEHNELVLTGTLTYTKEDWLEAIKLVNEKRILVEPLISARFPLSGFADAFRYIEENKKTVLKVLIETL